MSKHVYRLFSGLWDMKILFKLVYEIWMVMIYDMQFHCIWMKRMSKKDICNLQDMNEWMFNDMCWNSWPFWYGFWGVTSIVCNDLAWNTVSADDVLAHEFGYVLHFGYKQRYVLNPFGEIVNCHYDVWMSIGYLLRHRPYHIDPPHGECLGNSHIM